MSYHIVYTNWLSFHTRLHLYLNDVSLVENLAKLYKKFELMLTRRTKAYSSFCLQMALVYLQPFHRKSLLKCAALSKIAKTSNLSKAHETRESL